MNKLAPPHKVITDSYREVGEALLKKLASQKKPKKAS
jgi:hypothetical protein